MSFHGGPFLAQEKNGRIEGKGLYTYPFGNTYVGEFKDGRFHGKGTLYFTTGGKYDADWVEGKAQNGKYTFSDGLVFSEENWEYCTPEDRRFYREHIGGFSAAESHPK